MRRGAKRGNPITAMEPLSREEQIVLGRKVQKLVTFAESRGVPTRILKADGIGKLRQSATEEELRIVEEGLSARSRYVMANTRLVMTRLKRALSQNQYICHVEESDLLQEGIIGLLKAIENYRPELGYAFSTYADWWIKQEIDRAIQRSDTVVSVSGGAMRNVWDLEGKIFDLRMKKMESGEGAGLGIDELCEATKKTESQVSAAMLARVATRCLPIEETKGDFRSTEWHPRKVVYDRALANEKKDELDDLAEKMQIEEVLSLVSKLPDGDRKVFELRFGINCKEHTYREISEKTGCTEKRAKKIIDVCIAKIRLIMGMQ